MINFPSSLPLDDNPSYDGYLDQISQAFDTGVLDLQKQLDDAKDALAKDPSSPSALATYQMVMSEYNLYRNAQSSAVKSMKDIDSSIVSNFR
ncbi:type III secretion system needle complex protein [Burkholderia ubonensis]|uniref:type III secretion system needle complex protein n=1 Tax=Burkholderia ubonensis TaxID=101571 RepID=UPI0009B48EF2|nr:type III secretion system needle complex protein [Burkholderia ubonensis]